MGYMNPSHDPFHKPGDEGSCPPETKETIEGMSYPNGDQSVSVATGPISLPFKSEPVNHGGGPSTDPTTAMPGA